MDDDLKGALKVERDAGLEESLVGYRRLESGYRKPKGDDPIHFEGGHPLIGAPHLFYSSHEIIPVVEEKKLPELLASLLAEGAYDEIRVIKTSKFPIPEDLIDYFRKGHEQSNWEECGECGIEFRSYTESYYVFVKDSEKGQSDDIAPNSTETFK